MRVLGHYARKYKNPLHIFNDESCVGQTGPNVYFSEKARKLLVLAKVRSYSEISASR